MTASVGAPATTTPAIAGDTDNDGELSVQEFNAHYDQNLNYDQYKSFTGKEMSPEQVDACIDSGMKPEKIQQCLDAGMRPKFIVDNTGSIKACLDQGLSPRQILDCSNAGIPTQDIQSHAGEIKTCIEKGMTPQQIKNCLNNGMQFWQIKACLEAGVLPIDVAANATDIKICFDAGIPAENIAAFNKGGLAFNEIPAANQACYPMDNAAIKTYAEAGVPAAKIPQAFKTEQEIISKYGVSQQDARTYVSSLMGNKEGGGRTVEQVLDSVNAYKSEGGDVKTLLENYAGAIDMGGSPTRALSVMQAEDSSKAMISLFSELYGNDSEQIGNSSDEFSKL